MPQELDDIDQRVMESVNSQVQAAKKELSVTNKKLETAKNELEKVTTEVKSKYEQMGRYTARVGCLSKELKDLQGLIVEAKEDTTTYCRRIERTLISLYNIDNKVR